MMLETHHLSKDDVYRDIARVPEAHRKAPDGRRIREGTICKITIEGHGCTLVALRGSDDKDPVLRIDEKLRNDLGVTLGREYHVELRPVGWFQQWQWAWHASDPMMRLASRLAVLSVVLGFLGLVLGVIGLVLGLSQTGRATE